MKKGILDIETVSNLYEKYKNLHKVAKELHTSHIRLSKFLKNNSIDIQNIGKRKDFSDEIISKMINEYSNEHKTLNDISSEYGLTNKKLSLILKENGINVNKWNGHIKKEKPIKLEKEYKHCPYCNWKTLDITGEKHSYSRHLLSKHKINLEDHLKVYPNDKEIIGNTVNYQKRISCPLCGKKLFVIDDRHLQRVHGITKYEFINGYKEIKLTSEPTKLKLQQCMQKMMDNDEWERKTSNYEKDIQSFLTENNISFIPNYRDALPSKKEIDIFIPQYNIGIEFNGNIWHTETFGKKDKYYHLNKLNECNENGIQLIEIFEDEYVLHKDIVISKIKHLLHLNVISIYARKCNIKEINAEDANIFLELNHIQGFAKSSVYLGGFYNNELVAVMTFLESNIKGIWELNRFATVNNKHIIGIGGKLFSYFIKKYIPKEIKSFADRRWTLNKDDNLYIKLGFTLSEILPPDYRYFSPKADKFKRFHKFNFRKQILNKKYGFPLTMTEREMTKELGYDRIWDCGLFKYVWYSN